MTIISTSLKPARLILRLFATTGGLAVRSLFLHDGKWPSLTAGAGLGLLATGLMSCAAPQVSTADWYQRCAGAEIYKTGWLTEAAYLKTAAEQRASGCYPLSLKAMDAADAAPSARLYRAVFKPHPDNITDWRASLNATPAEDMKLDATLTAQGYVRIWQDDVTTAGGDHRVQGIWALPN